MVLSRKRITKALIRLRGCAGWSAPVLFANPRRQLFSRRGPCISYLQHRYVRPRSYRRRRQIFPVCGWVLCVVEECLQGAVCRLCRESGNESIRIFRHREGYTSAAPTPLGPPEKKTDSTHI